MHISISYAAMKLTSMSFPLILIVRVTQGVFAALVLVLSGFGEYHFATKSNGAQCGKRNGNLD